MKSLRDPKRRPTHPGAILREDVLPALKMTQTEFAQRLGVSRLSVSDLLHEKRSMTPEMAARVANRVGLESNPHNFLLMHAMGPNVAGVIGSAVAAGVLLALCGN